MHVMDEQAVQRFSQAHACGDARIGALRERFHGDYEKFCTDYDQFQYQDERHLPVCIDGLDVSGKQVLEIGLGGGSDSERLIRLPAPPGERPGSAAIRHAACTGLHTAQLSCRCHYLRRCVHGLLGA